MRKCDEKLCQKAFDSFQPGDMLWHNTKLLEDGETIQIRVRDDLRVCLKVNEDWEKELVAMFKKENHKSHR